MGQGPQKPDHKGSFTMTPRKVTGSLAWRHLSFRARAVLQAFQDRHNGFNNGEIGFGLKEIGSAIGSKGHGANAKAVAELIEKGFLEMTSDFDRAASKVRQYRITFIPTGRDRNLKPATNEYLDWRPGPKDARKFGGANIAPSATESGAPLGANTAPMKKVSGANTAPRVTESSGLATPDLGAKTAPLIGNHPNGIFPDGISTPTGPDHPNDPELVELRQWSRAVIKQVRFARELLAGTGIPEPTFSKFRSGKNLPSKYRDALRCACARHLPYSEFREAA